MPRTSTPSPAPAPALTPALRSRRLPRAAVSTVLVAGLGIAAAVTALPQAAAATTTATYTADLATVFPNPERGFHNRYEIVDNPAVNDYASNTISGFNPDMLDRTFARARADGDTLIHSYVHLDKYKNGDLPQALLDNLASGLAAIRQNHLKIVLRFAYTWSESSAVPEAQIMRHIDQVAPVLNANADVIEHLEAGFLGAWGEWHDSQYTDFFNADQALVRYRIVKKLTSSLSSTIPVALRYPIFYKEMMDRTTAPPDCTLPNGCLLTQSEKDRLGFHDDCFLSDSADMGTYDQNSWMGWYYVEQKKQWMYDMRTSGGGNKMVGGETCDSAGDDDAAGVNAQREMAALHFTEINEDYAPVNLDLWKAAHLPATAQDPAETLFNRARRKLGYRLRLKDATFPTSAAAGSTFSFAAHLANDGYAGLIHQRPVFLVLDDGTHRYNVQLGGVDARTWLSGDTTLATQNVTLPAGMAPGTYKLALWLPDQATNLRSDPAYSVRLANQGTWDAAAGYNVLARDIAIGGSGSTPTDPPTDPSTNPPTDPPSSSPTPTDPASPTPTSSPTVPAGAVLVDDFDNPARYTANLNGLGRWTGGNSFLNGSGSGAVAAGALALQYGNAGWFGSDIYTDVSAKQYLVLQLKGAHGGEEGDFQLSVGGASKVFKDYVLADGSHPKVTTSFTDIRIPLAANGISATAPGQLSMGFWYGGSSTLSLASIYFA
ncbi:DUF4832 domain-containing protein [Peterkaempfera bronchialis]|uniref:DUF4832 domain-containing protein n=1 Tax=Peterkaempfera bronchialis TaxID=2126346 RepID=A0A345SSV0_9ACTN|nr:DUF4832 domain-containing protein [Peterkaempfera bronchialis]AXI76805.1 DUF4832 domain-containing protein [Peterkaempfera bronchialis]